MRGDYGNFALFSCCIDGSPGAAVVAANECPPAAEREPPQFVIRPLYVSVTPPMTITDHNGRET